MSRGGGFAAAFAFLLAAILGPRDFGVVAVAMVYITFVQIILDQGLLRLSCSPEFNQFGEDPTQALPALPGGGRICLHDTQRGGARHCVTATQCDNNRHPRRKSKRW